MQQFRQRLRLQRRRRGQLVLANHSAPNRAETFWALVTTAVGCDCCSESNFTSSLCSTRPRYSATLDPTMSDNQTYFNAVKFLEGLIPAPGHQHRRDHPDIFIKRTRALLDALDYQFGKTKFIHITGTAGKGSTANVIYQLLLKNDKRVGLFTSPFVTTTIERIAANGLYISPLEFAKLTERIKPAITLVSQNSGFGCPSYFECLLAIALIYFQQENCQYQIIEVGIGGRFDSTNIIPEPVVAAITNIGLDHTEILGKTLIEIASDKAGIIKQGCHFFTTCKSPTVQRIILKSAETFNRAMRKNKALIIRDIKIEIDYDNSHPLAETEKVIRECFEKVDKFFSFSSVKPETIRLELMYSRQEINKRLKRETEDWMSARVEDGVIVIFDPDALVNYSSHSRNEFPAIVVHELTHIFTRAINSPTLDWVNEGLAQYVAAQDSGRPINTDDFELFLENHLVTNTGYTNFINRAGYRISYLLVTFIIRDFGQSSIEKLISLPGSSDCTKQIEKIFDAPIENVKQQLSREVIPAIP